LVFDALFALNGLTQRARLLRNVPEKAEGFPFGTPPDHPELPPFVACQHGLSLAMRKALVFFRPITQRIKRVGASLIAINSIALCEINTPAICHFSFKLSLKMQRRTTSLIRSVMGLKKRSLSPVGRGQPCSDRYRD
jgi:hypothetical protein